MLLACTTRAAVLMLVPFAFGFEPAAAAAGPRFVHGTAVFQHRVELPPRAMLEAALAEFTAGQGAARTIATTRVTSLGSPPIAFTLAYDPASIVATHRYVVRARIVTGGRVLFTSESDAPVITQGSPREVTLALSRVSGAQAASPLAPPLARTYWRAMEVAGHPLPARDRSQEPHLQLLPSGRLAGADGCGPLTGGYALNGGAITFAGLDASRTACPAPAKDEEFRDALKRASRWTISGSRLELFDATGSRLAVFEGSPATAVRASSVPLEGTAWKLVRFQGGDDTVLVPRDSSKYTLQFEKEGRLSVRLDCNRGRGTWKSNAPNQLQLGPLAITRARCAAGSLSDQIARHWRYIWSFVIRDGHLFLSLTADGGTYEWAPCIPAKPA